MKTSLTIALALTATSIFAQQKEQITVHFDFDKASLSKTTIAQLDSFALTDNAKTAFLGIYGHCDSVGNDDYNDDLSYKRVVAVKRYLISKGVSSDNIKEQIFFGKKSPLNNNQTEEERALNRRVEIVINDDRDEESNVSTELVKEDTVTAISVLEEQVINHLSDTVTLKNLNFYGGRSLILPSSFSELNNLLDLMRKYPTLEISIEGHICCVPNAGDGLDIETQKVNLSESRAKAIYTFLVQNDIKPERLSYKGFGHQTPLKAFPETTEAERTGNRRVEIRIVKR